MRDALFSWIEKSRASITRRVFAFIFITLLVPLTAVGANAPTVFEITGSTNRGTVYGGTGGTNLVRIAQRYAPPIDQTICTVFHKVRQTPPRGDGVVMRITHGGSNPDAGALIARVEVLSVPGDFVGTEVAFVLSECLTLSSGSSYWFIFEPRVYQTFGGTHSFYASGDQYPYTSYWKYDGFAAVGGGGWKEDTSREWSLRLVGPEPPPKKQPVIIVPGILGSRLNRVSDGEEVWPNFGKMLIPFKKDIHLNDLILQEDGSEILSIPLSVSGILESVSGNSVYGDLTKSFSDLGYATGTELFTVPYDWRLGVASSTFRLEEAVSSALHESPTGKVSIVAHSMGGLLVKEYLRGVTSTSFIDKLVLLGVPELGSPKAFKALTYGDNFGFGFGPVDIFNIERSKIISQNMPGVYELLPSREYFARSRPYIYDATGDAVSVPDYDSSSAFMMRDPDDQRNQFLLGRSDQTHSVLDGAGFNVATSSLYRIAGCQNPKTIGMIRVYPDAEFDIDPIDGDGTVPLASATASEVGHAYYALHSQTRIDHMGLAGDERVLAVVRDIITGASPSLTEGITQDIAACGFANPVAPNQTTLAFSTHSPVLLHLYDDQNRHTGPTVDGDIELGIPGSSYEVIGDNSFAWAPGGITYRIVIEATNSGEFNLKVKTMGGVSLLSQTAYIAVPLASGATSASLSVDVGGSVSALALDADGDGANEAELNPTSILSGERAYDAEPPEISFGSLLDGARFAHADSLVLSISATDSASGVATTSVELDGTRIAPETIIDLFDLSIGEHQIVASATDGVGNVRRVTRAFFVFSNKESVERDILRMDGLGWLSDGIQEELVTRTRSLASENVEVFLNDLASYRDRCYITPQAYEVLKNNIESLNYE